MYLFYFAVCCDKDLDQNWLEEEGLYLSSNSRSQTTIEGSQGRNPGKNLEAVTEAETMEAHCLLISATCFLMYPQATWPETALPIVDQVLLHHSSIKNMLS